MNFRTRPHFEDRQIVQYSDESITLSGITNIAPIVLNFTGTTTAETAVTISELTGYLNGGKISGFVVQPPILLQSGTTATTTTNVENFVLKALDPYGSVGWAPISGISWSVSACTSPLNVTNIVSCTPGGTVYFTAGDVEFGTANVGINVSPPTNELHVVGSIRMEDGNEQNGYVLISDASGVGSWQILPGTSSASCITDLWVTNVHGCSPITIWDSVQSIGSLATGTTSFALGINNSAYGIASFAEGGNTTANGPASHAEGSGTLADGDASHAEGYQTIALGDYSHVEGWQTLASGNFGSHAEGFLTIASGTTSHSEGRSTVAGGSNSHAEGNSTKAYGNDSHSEGSSTTAIGNGSHSEGNLTIASGLYSHAGGNQSIANGNTSFIHSTNSFVNGNRSVVLGGQNITGTTDDTVYVPYLNISNLSVGVPINNLGIDSSGNVVVGTSGSGSTTGIFSGVTILNITTGTSVSILGITSGGTIVSGSDLYGDICSYCSDVVSGDTFISTGITETNIINVDGSTVGSNPPYTCTLWCYYKGGTQVGSTVNYEEALKYESLGYVIRCCDGSSADGGTNFGTSISGQTTTSGSTGPTVITGLTKPYTINRTKKIALLNTYKSDVLSSNQVSISNSTLGRIELSTLSSIDSSFNSKIYNSYLTSAIGSENVFIKDSGNSSIISSQYSTLSGVTGSTIIGGNNIIATEDDTVYVPNIIIDDTLLPNGTSAKLKINSFSSSTTTYGLKIEDSSSNPILYVNDNAGVGIGNNSGTNPLMSLKGLHVSNNTSSYLTINNSNTTTNLVFGVEDGNFNYQVVQNGNYWFYGSDWNGSDVYSKYDTVNGNWLFSSKGLGGSANVSTRNLDSKVTIVGYGTGSSSNALVVNNVVTGGTFPESTLLIVRNDGNVGIGLSSPSEKLEISGKTKTTDFQMTNGAVNGYVLTSDSNGNATWQVSSGGGTPAATTATTTTINFTGQTIYYNAFTPGTGNITEDLTGAKLGLIQKVYHSGTTEPTYPGGWVLMGDAIYFPYTLNIIYAEWATASRVEYWYVQQQ